MITAMLALALLQAPHNDQEIRGSLCDHMEGYRHPGDMPDTGLAIEDESKGHGAR